MSSSRPPSLMTPNSLLSPSAMQLGYHEGGITPTPTGGVSSRSGLLPFASSKSSIIYQGPLPSPAVGTLSNIKTQSAGVMTTAHSIITPRASSSSSSLHAPPPAVPHHRMTSDSHNSHSRGIMPMTPVAGGSILHTPTSTVVSTKALEEVALKEIAKSQSAPTSVPQTPLAGLPSVAQTQNSRTQHTQHGTNKPTLPVSKNVSMDLDSSVDMKRKMDIGKDVFSTTTTTTVTSHSKTNRANDLATPKLPGTSLDQGAADDAVPKGSRLRQRRPSRTSAVFTFNFTGDDGGAKGPANILSPNAVQTVQMTPASHANPDSQSQVRKKAVAQKSGQNGRNGAPPQTPSSYFL